MSYNCVIQKCVEWLKNVLKNGSCAYFWIYLLMKLIVTPANCGKMKEFRISSYMMCKFIVYCVLCMIYFVNKKKNSIEHLFNQKINTNRKKQ